MTNRLKLYQFKGSGNCHRARLFLSLLGLPFDTIDLDRASHAQKAPEFLKKNPFGQVPVLEDGDLILSDSVAILVYLAKRYAPESHWLPVDAVGAARIQRWLSVASGEMVLGPMMMRKITRLGSDDDPVKARAISLSLFAILEGQLNGQEFLEGAVPTLADIALYTYVKLAPESGLSLESYPAILEWLGKIEALPGYVPV